MTPTEINHLGGPNAVQTEWNRLAGSSALIALQDTRPVLMFKDNIILSHNPKRCPLITLKKKTSFKELLLLLSEHVMISGLLLSNVSIFL